ncbi:MAG: 1-aminocyclopropane-1-carboxylate deaminase/D-cysteine desulfhydrase [Methylococcales symbiont of Hymedesmia sp. n. MRB-2018]|nr:MAG: 1-aminocyclopropane-1-carboxylate deaminase/D-cysteine desulfhydrase [Methylococcales symbiont of Hymedesmia sp. n. MRB-2018]KAF3984484.1 MAG: 1-aminocyclopropane-1-carboxylate deaminase/D-cysteine desulfhydrase [Methylococcales symbiont of Hymedesmia sp. n. MRB-2018]
MLHAKLTDLEGSFQSSTLTQIFSPLLEQKKIECWVKRDDLMHPIISGNKWRKLKYCLDHALKLNSHTIISMGGAYSNHLHALAYTCKQLGLNSRGIIRGEEAKQKSPTLLDLQKWGMDLRYVPREAYRVLRQLKEYDALPGNKTGEYWLPEGGATALALKGVADIVTELETEFDVICVPCGSGTTLAGIIASCSENTKVMGFSALKGAGFLSKDIEQLLKKNHSNKIHWLIQLDYHFGGFAKCNNELLLFINDFKTCHNIVLEPVYTAKMFYGLFDLIQQDHFKAGQKILTIHTGGLQGNR